MANYMVTGALGCIGAWVVRNLVQQGEKVIVYDLGTDIQRIRLIMDEDDIARVTFISGGDVTRLEMIEQTLKAHEIEHIIHLAALQVPFCKADPVKGALVNVVGHVNMFEAAKRAGLKRVVYASSTAVFGPKDSYPDGLVPNDAPHDPHTHYGVYKRANEGTARVYWEDDGISSLGFRPYTLYGPGRDQGLTSSPTKAMLAAAAGQPFHIPYGGYNGFHYTDDVAKMFIQAAHIPFEGAAVFNMKGEVASIPQVIEAIEAAEPTMKGKITSDTKPLPFPDGLDDAPLRALFGKIPDTPLRDGVAATIAHFKKALAEGKIAFAG